jgi:uncharacterized membrane-anchored protein
MTKLQKLVLAAALQAAIIFSLIAFKLLVLAGGYDVLLRIKPVDPRDVLRGDYVSFQYDISDLDVRYAGGQPLVNGQKVYVVLREAGKYSTVRKIASTKPEGGDLFISGKVASVGPLVRVVYGIEQYYIPEGRGAGFNFASQEASARVALDDDGNSVLKQVYLDGLPWPRQ